MTPEERSMLPTPAQIKALETTDPKIRDWIMTRAEVDIKHYHRMDVCEWVARVLGQIYALSVVIVLTLLARYFADHGAATQGAAIIIAGAGSIVAVFLTGRIRQPRQPSAAPGDGPAQAATDEA